MSEVQRAAALGLDAYTNQPDILKKFEKNIYPIMDFADSVAKEIYVEYYRYSLNGVKINETNNKKYKIKDISNEKRRNFIKNAYNLNDNAIVVEAKAGSPLYTATNQSSELRQAIKENYSDIIAGKFKNKPIYLDYQNGDLFPTLGKCVLHKSLIF